MDVRLEPITEDQLKAYICVDKWPGCTESLRPIHFLYFHRMNKKWQTDYERISTKIDLMRYRLNHFFVRERVWKIVPTMKEFQELASTLIASNPKLW